MHKKRIIPAPQLLVNSPLLSILESEARHRKVKKRLAEFTPPTLAVPHTLSFIFSDRPSWKVPNQKVADKLVKKLTEFLRRQQKNLDINFEVVINEDGFLEALVWGSKKDSEALRKPLKRFESVVFQKNRLNLASLSKKNKKSRLS